MLKIGEFSKLSRISIRLLRQYDDSGLLTPEVTDPFTATAITVSTSFQQQTGSQH